MNSFLLIGLAPAPKARGDSAPNAPAGRAADPFSALLTGVQKQFEDQGDHLDLCKLQLDGSAEVPVTTQLARATYDCILLGGGFREPEHLALFERVINTVHRHAPGAAIGLVNLPQDAPQAAIRVLSQDYERADLLSPSASLTWSLLYTLSKACCRSFWGQPQHHIFLYHKDVNTAAVPPGSRRNHHA